MALTNAEFALAFGAALDDFHNAVTTESEFVTVYEALLNEWALGGVAVARSAALASEAITGLNTFLEEARDWYAGTADGGPNSDGLYPLTDSVGNTYLVPSPAKIADTVPPGTLFGLTLQNNTTDASHDIDILSGVCASLDDYPARMALASTLTKKIDVVWGLGTGAGGLDTGTVAANTGYHVWIIRRPDTGVVDALFSTSATSPSMPANYTQKRRIGAILTDGSANIRPFIQTGGQFMLATPITVALGDFTTLVTVATGCPLGVKLKLNLLSIVTGSAAGYVAITDPDLGTPNASTNALFYVTAGGFMGQTVEVWCNTSGQISADSSAASAITTTTRLRGWYDLRDTNL